jgi:hypothetical protein
MQLVLCQFSDFSVKDIHVLSIYYVLNVISLLRYTLNLFMWTQDDGNHRFYDHLVSDTWKFLFFCLHLVSIV